MRLTIETLILLNLFFRIWDEMIYLRMLFSCKLIVNVEEIQWKSWIICNSACRKNMVRRSMTKCSKYCRHASAELGLISKIKFYLGASRMRRRHIPVGAILKLAKTSFFWLPQKCQLCISEVRGTDWQESSPLSDNVAP